MISFSHVVKTYAGRSVLSGVSLAIEQGSFVALVGQSGAGKTTLLKAVNRLIEIDAGSIRVDDADIKDQPVAALRRQIGYVFQDIGLFPHMTVAENIWLVPRLQGMSVDARESRIDELLDLVALPRSLASRYPAQLSGGQAQRVGFARALAAGPAIMLMDEPFGALDPVTRSELGHAYRELHKRIGLTSLMVTHDIAEALLLTDRVIVLAEGRVIADMPPRALIRHRGDARVMAMIDAARQSAEQLEALARDD